MLATNILRSERRKVVAARRVKTGTKAGDANRRSFIYGDKETNLPLHTESIISSSETSAE